jgi:hypothetical protein
MVRQKFERERDKQYITEWYLKGYSCRSIAVYLSEKVGIPNYLSYKTISKEVAYIISEWQKERIDDINHQKTIELEKLNKLERTYWMAWEKSIEDYEKKAKKMKGPLGFDKKGEQLKPTEQELHSISMTSFGNPSYLSGIERCIERRCKILGIDAPQKHDITSNGIGFADFLKTTSNEVEE